MEKERGFFKNKVNWLLLVVGLFVLIAVFVAAATISSIDLHSPSPGNNTVITDTTPSFNFSVSGSETNYSCRLNICDENYTLYTFNTTGELLETGQCSGDCDFNCECDASKQYYKSYNCSNDMIYVDCVFDRCWSETVGATYAWGGYGTDEPTDSCIGVASREACNYCDNLDYGGFTDWTLANKSTLLNLCSSASCPSTCFGGEGVTGGYWSSTEYSADVAWYVTFSSCDAGLDLKTYTKSVRCIRT